MKTSDWKRDDCKECSDNFSRLHLFWKKENLHRKTEMRSSSEIMAQYWFHGFLWDTEQYQCFLHLLKHPSRVYSAVSEDNTAFWFKRLLTSFSKDSVPVTHSQAVHVSFKERACFMPWSTGTAAAQVGSPGKAQGALCSALLPPATWAQEDWRDSAPCAPSHPKTTAAGWWWTRITKSLTALSMLLHGKMF